MSYTFPGSFPDLPRLITRNIENRRKIEFSGACPEPVLTYKIASGNRIEATTPPIDSFYFKGGRKIGPE